METMVAFAFLPTFALWLITYGVVKYPAQALGRVVVRLSPNILFDASISVGLTLLCWYVVFGLLAIYTIGQRDQHSLTEIGTMVALGLGPPLLVAFFKGTLRARSTSKAL